MARYDNRNLERFLVSANAGTPTNTGINNIPVGATGVLHEQNVKGSASAASTGYTKRRVVFYNVYYSSAYHTVTITVKQGTSGLLACLKAGLTVTKV